jgi:C4-dicarboxylate-specific signal transduction histidine kinase
MISFLFSLCVVDSKQRAWRVAQRADSEPWPLWKRLSSWTWWNAEPYQFAHDSTWQHAVPATSLSDGADGTVPTARVNTDRWFTRKKHRKMAKLSVSEAIAMREGMAAVLVTAALVGLVVIVWLTRRMLSSIA